jgi:hypothetical protein
LSIVVSSIPCHDLQVVEGGPSPHFPVGFSPLFDSFRMGREQNKDFLISLVNDFMFQNKR